jgi:hypothetical protein
MFVLTDDDNIAALATYEAGGGRVASRNVMLEWDFGRFDRSERVWSAVPHGLARRATISVW